MAFLLNDHIHTNSFTPKEHQVELLYSAKERNIIICLGKIAEQTFITTKLIQELSIDNRKKLSDGGKRIIYLFKDEQSCNDKVAHIEQVTDLKAQKCSDVENFNFEESCSDAQVLVITVETCYELLTSNKIPLNQISLLVIDKCHRLVTSKELKTILKLFKSYNDSFKITGFAVPLYNLTEKPGHLSYEIERIQSLLGCEIETASDLLSILRYSPKPKEYLLTYKLSEKEKVEIEIKKRLDGVLDFLENHSFNPGAIYGDFLEEIQKIPDPTEKPKELVNQFLNILDTLGPWAADRAALVMLGQLEKLKLKTPYDRHYLLLAMVSTALIGIRAYCDYKFQKVDENKRVKAFSSPKIHRLIEVLKTFTPPIKEGSEKVEKAQSNEKEKHDEKETEEESNHGKENVICNSTSLDSCDGNQGEKIEVNNHQIKDKKMTEENKNNQMIGKKVEGEKNMEIEKIEGSTLTEMDETHKENELKIGELKLSELSNEQDIHSTHQNMPSESSVEQGNHNSDQSKPSVEQNNYSPLQNIPSKHPDQQRNFNSKGRSHNGFRKSRPFRHPRGLTDPDLLCGVIFVDDSTTAKILHSLLFELSKTDEDLRFIHALYTVERTIDDTFNEKDAGQEHRKQEEVLKKFRIHECNLLISTSILEEGIDIPKCNFVMRFNFPKNYQSYVQCKSRARAIDALHVLLVPEVEEENHVQTLAHYHYIEKILLEKCSSSEILDVDETEADAYNSVLPEYKPLNGPDAPRVCLNSAISLVNRYCAKLPSDTFTKLTPEWKINPVTVEEVQMYVCSLRLPINSPLKYVVSSYPMPNKALAKRMAALQLCVRLHKENEIDDYLIPVGKENFKANPQDTEVPALPDDEKIDSSDARPGTTKRRQYYYKKIAASLTDCKPEEQKECYLYHISMVLSCPLPEEQNTRGRKIYPPEESAIGFGILTKKKIPKVCPFPIYTRSGEVHVDLKLSKETVVLDETKIEKMVAFLNYTFTNVLRLQKFLMLFDPNVSENSYIIVPVKQVEDETSRISVDWDFLECIYENRNKMPHVVSEEERRDFTFDPSKYHDAVIMPWYRNQDQPQYFYVAEICNHLNPKSSFPGADYSTFEEYYHKKYGIQIQNLEQPLLDVDHTSARLNFLTPRYVNRKGVALPTSSEETKRAKRENLEQKQILIAELCAIHPFPASLWRQAVCLPCILYRINALLLADQIRRQVSLAINLGQEDLPEDFHWPPLNFGWSLADVLKKSKENEKAKQLEEAKTLEMELESLKLENNKEDSDEEDIKNTLIIEEIKQDSLTDFGTWDNNMADGIPELQTPLTLTEIKPSDFQITLAGENDYDDGASSLSGGSWDDDQNDSSYENDQYDGTTYDYIQTDVNEAETVEKVDKLSKEVSIVEQLEKSESMQWTYKDEEEDSEIFQKHKEVHIEKSKENEELIRNKGILISGDSMVTFSRKSIKVESTHEVEKKYEDYILGVSKNFTNEYVCSESVTLNKQMPALKSEEKRNFVEGSFSFDYQPELDGHSGPSPSLILTALTMSNANDGINLERLETIGDSFLKYAITMYLFCAYNNIHEGKLSHLRSKQVSNLNLYRLGRKKILGESMIATKFEPHDNWLPPCYYVPKKLEQALIESGIPSVLWNQAQEETAKHYDEVDELVREAEEKLNTMKKELCQQPSNDSFHSFIPYNLITQHSIPDKSIADCVEALIGAYLIACGPRGALLFMSYLGIHVLPMNEVTFVQDDKPTKRPPGSTEYIEGVTEDGKKKWTHTRYDLLQEPPSPLFYNIPEPEAELEIMLDGYDALEKSIGYKFKNRSYLLQAFTHASYQPNRLTDCYQRLEFLGDAVLDYLITRHLYEDPRQHSPGALTDLRSALVNNTIFASLAVRCGFHKYFRHLSPGLNTVIDRFVRIQEENGHTISEEFYFRHEADENLAEEAEDVEVPKALGDVFESLAGAIFLDSNMSLDAVWLVYYEIMKKEIEQFSANVPKSPIRELLELEPETAKFGRPEKLADGRRVRVTVDVFNKGLFKGIGRNYRIAKCTAAKCALKKLKKMRK